MSRFKTKLFSHMWTAFWNSLETVSFFSSFSNWMIAIFGICALILSNRKDVLADQKSLEEDRQRDALISANNFADG